MNESFLDFIIKGNWAGNLLMLLLFILSLVSVYLFVERFIVLRSAKKQIKDFIAELNPMIASRKYQEATKFVEGDESIAAEVLRKSLKTIGNKNIGINEANLVIDTIAGNELSQLEKGFSSLASISGGAPMIGFLGTVIGMVQAFYQMSIQKSGFEIASLSQGIYTAMFTTVGGLVVGLIAYFAYNMLVADMKKIATKLESVKIGYIELRNQYVD